jgi:hypothetical protein
LAFAFDFEFDFDSDFDFDKFRFQWTKLQGPTEQNCNALRDKVMALPCAMYCLTRHV